MPAFNLDNDAKAITECLNHLGLSLVACLCAQWCKTCRDYRATFDRLADQHPDICFVWIDIETHADQLDEFDVENFPTILIEDQHARRFFGTVLPHASIVERMLIDLSTLDHAANPPRLRALLGAAASE
jgi:thiol-disulfide isomerase/thioredoxin